MSRTGGPRPDLAVNRTGVPGNRRGPPGREPRHRIPNRLRAVPGRPGTGGARDRALRQGAYDSWTTARALDRTRESLDLAVRATTTRLSSSFSSTTPLTVMTAPWSSSGTTTMEENRTP